jgi:hypothetical protein
VSSDEADLGHRNLISYCRALSEWSGGHIEQDDDVLLCTGGSWLPVVGNSAFRLHDGVAGNDLIDRADAFFSNHGRGYCVKTRDTGQDDDLVAACRERGLVTFTEPAPQMIIRDRLEDPVPPAGIELAPVADELGVAEFVAVNTEAYATYGMPDDVLADTFNRLDLVLADEQTTIVVARRDGQPVATALTYVSDGTGALQWVGTVSGARQLGLGRLVTVWATNLAFDRGIPACTLQASPMGEPVYLALGYERIYRYQDHVRWHRPAT